jgi:hypothetical protein
VVPPEGSTSARARQRSDDDLADRSATCRWCRLGIAMERRSGCGPLDRSASQLGYTSAPRKLSAGMAISNGIRLLAMVRCCSQLAPPSNERLNAITFAL